MIERDRYGAGYEIIKHKSEYRVEGEVGRFKFGMFDVVGPDDIQVFKGTVNWPSCQGKQWHKTCGFQEIALLSGATQRSYRKTTHDINRWRRQENGEGTPLTTLQGMVEAEGSKVLGFMEKQSEQVLETYQFNANGTPKSICMTVNQVIDYTPMSLTDNQVKNALASVEQSMRQRDLTEEEITGVKHGVQVADYEQSEDTVNISIDDVGVKKQKAQRQDCGTEKLEVTGESVPKNRRPTVQNTVAQIAHGKRYFTLTGTGVLHVLTFVLAFLLRNNLILLRLRFFTDGQRNLQNSIVKFFFWHPSVSLILDWFHVVKKFKEDLSSACRGRHTRNEHLRPILRLLWFGLVDQAQNYLHSIPDSDLKNAKIIARLVEYLERNRKWIPCYALRKQLGLTNSSNAVERANNLVTSQRQKHNGMSWSKAGSHALTALSAIVLNGRTREWVKNKEVNLEFAAAA